jgi:hypothetical protein
MGIATAAWTNWPVMEEITEYTPAKRLAVVKRLGNM